MTTQNYLIVRNNVVTNCCLWDGNINTWTPPSDATMLVQATTIAMLWVWDDVAKNWVLQEQLGIGGIGFTWDGNVLTTNEPQPVNPPQPLSIMEQPASSGTQTL